MVFQMCLKVSKKLGVTKSVERYFPKTADSGAVYAQ